MCAQRDSQWAGVPQADGDPEVIDVGGDAVNFGGKRDRLARDVNKLAVLRLETTALRMFSALVWQELLRRRGRGRGRGRRWSESAVPFVDVNSFAHEGNIQILAPFAGREFAVGLQGFA